MTEEIRIQPEPARDVIGAGDALVRVRKDFVPYELTRWTCPRCEREVISLTIDGLICEGGRSWSSRAGYHCGCAWTPLLTNDPF